MKNPDLLKEVTPTESELKEIIVNYVGNTIAPDTDEVTVEDIVNVFAEQFPEFLLVLAEENWINGYTQALTDTQSWDATKDQEDRKHDDQELYKE
tara:strand:- start:208 stop:492 length:285 start_codon:yes stop_codon:yes gene_type:complete